MYSGTDSPYKVEADGTAALITNTYTLMKARGIDIRRLRLAAICTVCVKPFLKEINQMVTLLEGIGFIKHELATNTRSPGCRTYGAQRPENRPENWRVKFMENKSVDALVVGGGIAGMQASLDLADQGYQVALVERLPTIGGKMIQLSKVFPTLDCCSCITTPKMSAVAHHPNIDLMTYCEVQQVDENSSGFQVQVLKKPRYVDEKACTGCRNCEFECPVTVPSIFDRGLGAYRAVRVPFSTALPQTAVLDMDYCLLCGKCEKACPVNAIDFTQQPELFEIQARSIVLATGFERPPLDAKIEYGGGKLHNVIDPMMMERFLAPTGPYGRVLRPGDGKEPMTIAYVQCTGSRDETLGVDYCSRVCCMYAIKQAMLLMGALPWRRSPFTTWISAPLVKVTNSFTPMPRRWGSSLSAARWLASPKMKSRNPVVRVGDDRDRRDARNSL